MYSALTTLVVRATAARSVADNDRVWTPVMCTQCQRGYQRPADDGAGHHWTCHRCDRVTRPQDLPDTNPADMLADRDDVLQIGIHPDAAYGVQIGPGDPETFTPRGVRTYLREAFGPYRDVDITLCAATLNESTEHVSPGGVRRVITRTA